MWKLIDKVFIDFKKCFKREATFQWFAVIIVGFMVRTDTLGVTSVIRDLAIAPESYTTMIHFFRSNAWNPQDLITTWSQIVKAIAPICKEDGMTILIGDGVKQSKEARKMPGVKKLHQESENSSKAEYIFGHMFGGVGVLIGAFSTRMFCVPLSMKIHDDVKTIRKWDDSDETEGSHIVQMIENSFNVAEIMGKSMPKLKKYTKKGDANPIEAIQCEETKKLILSTLKAIEGYVMCSCIAIGLLQIISITFSKEINKTSFRFLRTKSNMIVSEATAGCFLRKNIFLHIGKNKWLKA